MTTFVTPDEMYAAETSVIASGRSAADLMREAATRIAAWIDTAISRTSSGTPHAVALVGPGNNGGDALVALALLIERGWNGTAILLRRSEFGDLPVSPHLLGQIHVGPLDELDHADIIIDGVFGFRSRPTLPTEIAAAMRAVHRRRIQHRTPIIAIDVPTGIDAGTGAADADAIWADVTLCIGLPKIGLIQEPAASRVGELILLDIGIAPLPAMQGPQLLISSAMSELVPRRTASAHKHTVGSMLIVGGAPNYYGAPRLSAEAALRVGAGLVAVAVPAGIAPVVATQVPEAVIVPLDDSDSSAAATQVSAFVEERASILRAAVVGPGLGRSPRASALLDILFGDHRSLASPITQRDDVSYVFDADALNWISDLPAFPRAIRAGSAVLTPHAGELARLLKCSTAEVLADPLRSGREAAERFQQVIVVKSGYAKIISPQGNVAIAPRATPELATAGTGDVLAGTIGGLLAQGMSPFDAACAGVYVGAMAGHAARARHGTAGVIARDVIDELPSALANMTDARWAL